MKKAILFFALAILLPGVQAKIKLPHIISSGMVIQQSTDIRLWGWNNPGTIVMVSTSWSSETSKAKTDKDGKWMVTVKSPEASFTPLSITFDDGEETTIDNVLSGEVWVCAGQSNMEMPLKGFTDCPVDNSSQEIENAVDGIRSAKIPSIMSATPLEDSNCVWSISSPQTVGTFSAVGYFFAKTVRTVLNIPVGLIEANKGGTRVESWLDEANLKAYTNEETDSLAIVSANPNPLNRQLLWGNGTFHPILNYTIRGILFYQGCSNVGAPDGQYTERLKLLVEQWRRDFDLGVFPFYFCEIAPYDWADINSDENGEEAARLREQQYKATKVIPNSAMISTNDLVYPYEISQGHPAQKQKVGERLAYLALNRDYGQKHIICYSPVFERMRIVNDSVFIELNLNSSGINRLNNIQGFELAGEDKVFYPAEGYFNEVGEVVITCPNVKKPVAARYCFRNFQIGNLSNSGGLPLIPFRTDNW